MGQRTKTRSVVMDLNAIAFILCLVLGSTTFTAAGDEEDIGVGDDTISGLYEAPGGLLQCEQRLEELEAVIRAQRDDIERLEGILNDLATIDAPNDGKSDGVVYYTGDCAAMYEAGVRTEGPHYISLTDGQHVRLLCDMDELYQWTIIQKRVQGDTLFNRTFDEYKQGFGGQNASSDFWLGLETVHQLTSEGSHILRIELTDWDNETRVAEYMDFSIGDERSGYQLRLGSKSGSLCDSLAWHNNMRFSTYDRDQDTFGGNCATSSGGNGGWWYRNCHHTNLNGEYRSPPRHRDGSSFRGIRWLQWRGLLYSYKATSMKFRRYSP